MGKFNFPTQKEQYTKILADHVSISVEDLNETELGLIDRAYLIFKDNLEEIKVQSDEVKRLSIELANIKSMNEKSLDNDFYCHDELVANACEDYDFIKCSKQCLKCKEEINK